MGNQIDLEVLGLTKEELQERVIDRIAEMALGSAEIMDIEGEEHSYSPFRERVHAAIQKRIDQSIEELAEKHILPNVSKYIEEIVLHKTNEWGEKKGLPVTFIEYLVQRADYYMQETVNSDGKSSDESCSSFRFSGKTTRIAYMIHKHLRFSIETAMKKALENANSSIVGGIEKAVKIKLAEIQESFKVEVGFE